MNNCPNSNISDELLGGSEWGFGREVPLGWNRRVSMVVAAACVVAVTGTQAGAQTARVSADGSFQVAGRRMKCENVRTRMDRDLPNLGIAVPAERLLLINPVSIGRQPGVVQMFVYAHECGHHRVGASELGADCWAVHRGVTDGWLSRDSLHHICRSFGGRPATATHPSAQNRCAALDRCFGTAFARHAPKAPPAVKSATPEAKPTAPATRVTAEQTPNAGAEAADEPRMVSQPRLLWTGEGIY